MTGDIITWMQWVQILFALVCTIRLITASTAADRLVALNVLSGVVLSFLVLRGVGQGRAIYLDVALVYDIFGFLGFLAIARFLKDRMVKEGEDS